jgi:spore coat protein A
VHSGGILLAPAERIDLLVRLTDLAGSSLTLWNSAPAPFPGDGNDNAADQPTVPDLANRRPFPHVMRIDIGALGESGADVHASGPDSIWNALTPDMVLNPAAVRLVHDAPLQTTSALPPPRVIENHQHRVIVLSESDPPGHLQLTEFMPDPRGAMQLVLPGDHEPITYAPIGSSFDDTVGITPTVGVWEVWRLMNTTGDTHPIHVHQSTFQPLGAFATSYTPNTYSQATRSTAPGTPLRPIPGVGRIYEPHETTGWKDTIRVNPSEMVSIAVRFDLTGRYVYHCHILEHEDREMMRPVVISAGTMMPGMTM